MHSRTFVFAIFTMLGLMSTSIQAHDCFKKPLQDRYNLKTVSCKTCHPNNKDRSIHNKFGIIVEKQLKGKELTKMFKEAEAKGEEAVEVCGIPQGGSCTAWLPGASCADGRLSLWASSA